MNKHSIITGIAIIIIVIPFVHSGLNIVGVQQLEYRWDSPGDFNFFTMSNSGNIEFCSTVPYWTSFQSFEIAAFYDTTHLGSFVVNPTIINPLSSTVQAGIFSSEEISAAQHSFMTLDFEFDGGDIRLDPNKFMVVINVDIPIIGLIPYSTSTQMTGFDFDRIMNSENLSCD